MGTTDRVFDLELFQVIVRLYNKGVRSVLVPNTVDLTQIPSVNYIPDIYRDLPQAFFRLKWQP
jgi:hypothetical protein